MQTFYSLAADFIVAFHFAYVAFVVFGLLLTIAGTVRGWQWVRNSWFRGIHLATILIVVAEAWLGIVCPLTTWEQQLRRLAGQSTYRGDFVGRWLHEVLFFEFPPWVFTVIYTLFGLVVIATWVFAPPRRRRQHGAPYRRTADTSQAPPMDADKR